MFWWQSKLNETINVVEANVKYSHHYDFVNNLDLQRRALRLIFPNTSYQQAQDLTNLSTLANRRILLCKKLMADMRDESYPIIIFHSSQSHNTSYAISIKIRKHYSSKNYEKDKESKWLFYI